MGASWTKIKLNLVSSFIKLVVSCHLKCTVYCEVYWIISSILSEKAGASGAVKVQMKLYDFRQLKHLLNSFGT